MQKVISHVSLVSLTCCRMDGSKEGGCHTMMYDWWQEEVEHCGWHWDHIWGEFSKLIQV